jgi:hypothetical protein
MSTLKRLTVIAVWFAIAMAIAAPRIALAAGPAEDLTTFRARLTAYMEDLAALEPDRVSPEVIASISRLDDRQLALLQKAYPSSDRFWSTPRTLRSFLVRNGAALGVPESSAVHASAAATSQFRSTTLAGAPVVSTFAFSNGVGTIAEGGTFTFSYSVSGDAGLKKLELWRALDKNGSADGDSWASVSSITLSGTSAASTFTYTPASFGTYWFGVHLIDANNVTVYEPAPIQGVVTSDPDKKCPADFDYEALWLARDAETVAEIAKEFIPDDTLAVIPHGIATTAWAVAKGLRFSVEQIYMRHGDCEAEKISAKIDTAVSTRAAQTSVDRVQSTLESLDLSKLDTNVSSRADQGTVSSIKSKVDSLSLDRLDTTVSSRSDQTTANEIKAKVNALDTANVDVKVSTRADQLTANDIKTKVNSLDTSRLDTSVSSRADQNSVNVLSNNLTARANAIDFSLANVQNKLNTIDGAKVDVALSTRATQTSVDAVAETLRVQEQLHVDVLEVVGDQRYILQVTKRGVPAAGATVQRLLAVTVDKNGALVSTNLTPAVREVAPGVLDITVTLPTSVKVTAYAITVNQGDGVNALAGSVLWRGKAQ